MHPFLVILSLLLLLSLTNSLNIVFMGVRRGKKGGIQQALEDNNSSSRGQEITGVTLPADGSLKGWEFGQGVRLVCANVQGQFYALQGDCPRCAFDLWKGDLIANDPAWEEDLPRVACPTCATTFSLRTGVPGAKLRRTGLSGLIGGLAQTATVQESNKHAKAYVITRDEINGKVFLKER